MAANSDIIKIGFDYETGLQEFLKDYDGTMSKVQKSADGKRVEIQFDVSDKDVIKKISALQSELKNVKIELNGKTLDQQLNSVEQLREVLTGIVKLINQGVAAKSIVDSDSVVDNINKIENRLNKLTQKYDEIQKKTSENISGKEISLVDNEEFQKLQSEVGKIKNEIDGLRTNLEQFEQDGYDTGAFVQHLSEQIMSAWENIEKLTAKFEEFHQLAEKVKIPSSETNISSGKNTPSEPLGASADASVKPVKEEANALDQVKHSAEEAAKAKEKFAEANKNVKQSADASVNAIKDEVDALGKVETFTPNTSGFDEILKKLNLTKSELVDIVKITKQSVADSDGKFHTSYTLKDSRGSSETYGGSSKTDKGQLLRSNIVSFDAKEASKSEVKAREEALNQMRIEESDYINEKERLLNEGKQQAKEAAEAELKERKQILDQMRIEESDYINEKERLLNEGKQQAKEAAEAERQSENKYYSDWSDAESINKTMDESADKIKKAKSEMLKLDLPSRLQDDFDELNKRIDELNKKLVKGDIGFGSYGDYVSNYVKAFSNKVKATASSDKANKKQSAASEKSYYSDWSNAEAINNSLIKTAQLLDELEKKTPDHLKMGFDNVKQSVEGLNAQLINGDKSAAAYDKAVQSTVDKFSKQIDNQKKSLETQLNSLINKTQKDVDSRSVKPKGFDQNEQYVNAVKEYKAQLAELRVFAEEISKTDVVSSEQLKRFEDLKKKVDDSAQSFKNLSAAEKGSTALSRDKLYNKIGDYLQKNSGMAKNFKDQLKALQNQLKDRGPNANVSDLTDQFVKLQAQIREAGQEGKSLFDVIKEKAFYGLASQLGMYFSLNDFIRYAQEGVNVVRELDTAFTEMQKVSDETAASLKNYQKTTFDTADAVGTTAMQIQQSTADWMRLGESLDKASESAKTSNILLNVSEFDNIEDATKSLVSMSQAYKDLDKLTIVDKLNEVGKFIAQTYSNVWCYKMM